MPSCMDDLHSLLQVYRSVRDQNMTHALRSAFIHVACLWAYTFFYFFLTNTIRMQNINYTRICTFYSSYSKHCNKPSAKVGLDLTDHDFVALCI